MRRGWGPTAYHFVDRWRVRGTEREVAEVLSDVTEYPRWWPSTYLSVTEVTPGDHRGIGRSGSVHARGWLPYTIRFDYCVVESDYPRRFSLVARGDLTGKGTWDIRQDSDWVNVTYTWTVRSDKRSLRYLSWLLKPVFRSNHTWTMRQGERSMALELRRRRAESAGEGTALPPPPGPIRVRTWAGGLAAAVLACWVTAKVARRVLASRAAGPARAGDEGGGPGRDTLARD